MVNLHRQSVQEQTPGHPVSACDYIEVLTVGKSHDMNVGKIWTHWESNSRPPECITWCAPPLHHMPLQSTFMFPGLPINRIYPLSTLTTAMKWSLKSKDKRHMQIYEWAQANSHKVRVAMLDLGDILVANDINPDD